MSAERNPSPAKWAYMKEMGKTRYITSSMGQGAATYFMFAVATAWVLPSQSIVVAFLLSWIHTSTFLFAVLAGFRAWYYWKQAEAGEALHQPTIHTPRFEGDLPPERQSERKSA